MALDFVDLGLGRVQVDYQEAWDLQRRVHAEVAVGSRPGTVLLLEHASVYTAGKRTEPHERPLDGTPVIDVDRGGKITWHGPGQLVGYPIVRLPESVGVVDYVRRLEEALIATMAEVGLDTGRVAGRSGVWLAAARSTSSGRGRPERKIAAIGVRVAASTTMHGFAANLDPDLSWFDKIVPCGISDAGVTSVAAELGSAPSLRAFADLLEPHLERYLGFTPYEKSADLAAHPAGVTYGLTVAAR
jgi:lipoyl(octanoyl) transferase